MDACDSTSVANSNFAGECSLRVVLEGSVDVMCDAGYLPGGEAICSSAGELVSVTCEAEPGPCDGEWISSGRCLFLSVSPCRC